MSYLGIMPVDWEERLDPLRMNRERLARAKQALDESGLDALFVFRTEDSRYITGYRHHLGPAYLPGNGTVLLPKGDRRPPARLEARRFRCGWRSTAMARVKGVHLYRLWLR